MNMLAASCLSVLLLVGASAEPPKSQPAPTWFSGEPSPWSGVLDINRATCTPPEKRYIVTLPLSHLTGEWRELTFAVCGKNRLDALVNSAATVWTEEEWAKAEKSIGVSKGPMGVVTSAPPTWGFSVRMETGPTVRVGGLATRDACWRVHKTLTDAHPEWVLGDCEEER